MASKIELHINSILEQTNESVRGAFKELSDFCISIGLKPKKVYKKNVLAVDFINAEKNYAILRFGVNQDKEVIFELRYYASEHYSEKFHDAIRLIIESYKGDYVGCYNCGNCQGRYVYYSDGKEYVRCGFAFVPVPTITREDVPEIKRLITAQNEFYRKQAEENTIGV